MDAQHLSLPTKGISRSRMRRWLVWAAGILAVVVVLFYVIENYRGAKAWESAVAMLEAEGETLDFEAFVEAPVPEAENFGAIPSLKDITVVLDGDSEKGEPGEKRKRLELMAERVSPGERGWPLPLPSREEIMAGKPIDFALLAEFMREHGDLPMPDDSDLHPARQVLAGLAEFEPLMRELEAALDRPYARLTPGLERFRETDTFFLDSVPHISALNSLSMVVALRTDALFASGDTAAGLRSMRVQFRLGELAASDGMLLGSLVHMSLIQEVQSTLWTLLRERRLGSADYEFVQHALAALDFPREYVLALRLDMVGVSRMLESRAFRKHISQVEPRHSFRERVLFSLIPSGWYDQNRSVYVRLLWDHQLRALKAGGTAVMGDSTSDHTAQLEKECSDPTPYNLGVRMLMPTSGATIKVARTQAFVGMMVIACALERFHLETDSYPETLDALVPLHLDLLPQDPLVGEPFYYARTDDGRYRIHSVGWNGVDDGGEIAHDSQGREVRDEGDWVWHYDPEVEALPQVGKPLKAR